MVLRKRIPFRTLDCDDARIARLETEVKLKFAISSSALGPLAFVLERLGRVVGVHVAEERQVGRQRLQAEVGVLEREHHLLEQHPVPARRQVQPVPAVTHAPPRRNGGKEFEFSIVFVGYSAQLPLEERPAGRTEQSSRART
jgi:hypothetical protein